MNLTILSESHPKRGKVCHQSDVFEPVTGVCKPCSEVERLQKNAVVPVSVPVPWFRQLSRPTPEAVKARPLPQR